MVQTNNSMPKVSVLIRTYNRPDALERAVRSVQQQTYRYIETIVVEDGKSTAESMLKENFPQMDLSYFCMGEKCGRAAAGNQAIKLSTGQYCNFLDDDDILYPQHIQKMVDTIQKTGACMAYAQALEVQLEETTHAPKRKLIRYNNKPSRLLLCSINYLPIQCVLFERGLFEKYGGFDESMDALEDWDLWQRFVQTSRLGYLPEVTSEYYTPYKSKKKTTRDIALKKAQETISQKTQNYHLDITNREVMDEMEYLLWEYKRSGIAFYLRKLRDLVLYRDR